MKTEMPPDMTSQSHQPPCKSKLRTHNPNTQRPSVRIGIDYRRRIIGTAQKTASTL